MNVEALDGFPVPSFREYKAACASRTLAVGVDPRVGMTFLLHGSGGQRRKWLAFSGLSAPFVVAVAFSTYAILTNPWWLAGLLLLVVTHLGTHPATGSVQKALSPLVYLSILIVFLISITVLLTTGHATLLLLCGLMLMTALTNRKLISMMVRGVSAKTMVDEEFLCLLWQQNAINMTSRDGRTYSCWKAAMQGSQPVASVDEVRADIGTNVKAETRASENVASEAPYVIEHTADGRLKFTISDSATPLDVLCGMVLALRPTLLPQHAMLADRWVSHVTGINVVDHRWTSKHEEAFLCAFRQFCYQGGEAQLLEPALTEAKSEIIGLGPNHCGDRYPLTDEIRALFRSWLSPDLAESRSKKGRETGLAKDKEQERELFPASKSVVLDMVARGRYHKENNYRNLSDWEKKMVNEFGPDCASHLKSIWDAIASS